jgi:hypothetical protein
MGRKAAEVQLCRIATNFWGPTPRFSSEEHQFGTLLRLTFIECSIESVESVLHDREAFTQIKTAVLMGSG